MRLPAVSSARLSGRATYVQSFGGLNTNLRVADGEFAEMRNLCGDAFPALTVRAPRYVLGDAPELQGLLYKDGLCVIRGGTLYFDGVPVDAPALYPLTEGEKTVVAQGAYLVIFPDKKYINRHDVTDCGSLENIRSVTAATLSLCDSEGRELVPDYTGAETPEDCADGYTWLSGDTVYVYSSVSGIFTELQGVSVKITASGIERGFAAGDGVQISGLTTNQSDIKGAVEALNKNAVITALGDDFLVVPGVLSRAAVVSGQITVSRTVPQMDFVVECANRLWGCRCGRNADGKTVNELYASKLGDFTNWNVFQGISTDSWAASLGSDGEFTGGATYLDSPVFFKENTLHRVVISSYGAHRVLTTVMRGVKKGCHGSLRCVNEVLYYKSVSDICAFAGSLPQSIGGKVPGLLPGTCTGGTHGNLYYLCGADKNGEKRLYAYDTLRGVWYGDELIDADFFTESSGVLYFADVGTHRLLSSAPAGGAVPEPEPEWRFTTGDFGYAQPGGRFLRGVEFRLKLSPGAVARFTYEADGGAPRRIGVCTGEKHGTRRFLLRPEPCETFRVTVCGSGGFTLVGMNLITRERQNIYD